MTARNPELRPDAHDVAVALRSREQPVPSAVPVTAAAEAASDDGPPTAAVAFRTAPRRTDIRHDGIRFGGGQPAGQPTGQPLVPSETAAADAANGPVTGPITGSVTGGYTTGGIRIPQPPSRAPSVG